MRTYRKKKKWRKFVLLFLLLIALLFYISVELGKRSLPYMKQLAIHEARNITSATLLHAVQSQPFSLEKSNEAYVNSQINVALKEIVTRAYEEFKKIEISVLETKNGKRNLPVGVIYEIPLGSITHIPFLLNAGPMIPIRMRLLGDVSGTLISKVTPYGINNALVELSVALKVHVQVVSVFMLEEVEVLQQIPLSVEIFEGQVPSYYPWTLQKQE